MASSERVSLASIWSSMAKSRRCSSWSSMISRVMSIFILRLGTAAEGGQGFAVKEEALERIVQPRHDGRALAAENAVSGARRREAELRARAAAKLCRIHAAERRGLERQLRPRHRIAVAEVPDARFAVDQQVEGRVHQVRHVSGRDGH